MKTPGSVLVTIASLVLIVVVLGCMVFVGTIFYSKYDISIVKKKDCNCEKVEKAIIPPKQMVKEKDISKPNLLDKLTEGKAELTDADLELRQLKIQHEQLVGEQELCISILNDVANTNNALIDKLESQAKEARKNIAESEKQLNTVKKKLKDTEKKIKQKEDEIKKLKAKKQEKSKK